MKSGILIIAFLVAFVSLPGQNTGIGTTNPSERLEVEGIIFSNQGGIKFPDSSLQTTAAFNADPINAADTNKLFAVMQVLGTNGILGPFHELGYSNAFKIIDVNIQPSRESGVSPELQDVSILKNLDIGTPVLYERLSSGQVIELIFIHFIKTSASTPEPYLTIGMKNIQLDRIDAQLVYKGNGMFAHIEKISLVAEQLSIKELGSANCYCWDYVSNIPCACID